MSGRPFFDEEEVNGLSRPARGDNAESLLSRPGLFFFKDIRKRLLLKPDWLKKQVEMIRAAGGDPWKDMGVRKVFQHWLVKMSVFAPYYRRHAASKVKTVPKDIDGNELLAMEGVFAMSDVAKRIPFTASQLRYQAKQHDNSKERCGLWKDEKRGVYLVDMARFSVWVRTLWQTDDEEDDR